MTHTGPRACHVSRILASDAPTRCDNLLHPPLVGEDTRMPDAVVMIATLAGIVAFGVNGLVLGPAIAATSSRN